ncbi:MAG: multidrug efflux SMR transporter [Acetobacteraceae bacterium]|nr:multidrug efflux SMR transporter [Acetobacteraceae bacterium]
MSISWAWFLLVLSGLVDVAWAIATKNADGFRNPLWAGISLVLLAIFVILLTRALAVLPLGVAYVVWVGIGALGSLVAGAMFFGEPVTAARLSFAALIVTGVIGLKATTA